LASFLRSLVGLGQKTIRSPSQDGYDDATGLFVQLCKKDFGKRLASIVLYGSASVKDHVSGFSDLDIMLIMENQARGAEDYLLLRKIKEAVAVRTGVEIHESWVFGKSLLLSIPTIWETLSAKTIYGESIIEKAPLVDLRKRTSIKTMHDLKDQWNRRKGSMTLEEKAKTALGHTLKFAQNALLYYDVVKMKKEDIVEAFEEKFREFRMRDSPRRAYGNILAWEEVKENETKLCQVVNDFERFHINLYWHVAFKTLLE
jgi:hypothetical protein